MSEKELRRPLRGVRIRRWKTEDIPKITACHAAAYNDYPVRTHYDDRIYELELSAFPEGQFLAEWRGEVIAYATSLCVQLEDDVTYSYNEITGSATFSSHDPAGDTLYGADIAVHPDFRGRGVVAKLYEARTKLLKRYNLRRMVAYGRIPGYADHAGKMTPEEYVEKVACGELADPALNAHLRAGYTVQRVVLDLFADSSSLNYSTVIEKGNPDFDPAKRKLAAPPLKRPSRRARVCAAQYHMRPISGWSDIERIVEFFVHTADTYHCHFLVLPELFTCHYLAVLARETPMLEAIDQVAKQEEQYLDLFRRLASEHQIYIVAGSHPVYRDGKLFNVAHLFSPAGNVYTQDKLHITPGERRDFGIQPGQGIKVFQTPLARVAIQVCYDIEFPEVSRLLALAGVEVVFVPFSTDERRAYQRVRFSAQSRCIENSFYTALAGNVGNLPHRSYLLNYGQASIFTPSDFGFPANATAAESDPNVETVAVADLDFSALKVHREIGSVRPLRDRRPDLYRLEAQAAAIEIVNVE